MRLAKKAHHTRNKGLASDTLKAQFVFVDLSKLVVLDSQATAIPTQDIVEQGPAWGNELLIGDTIIIDPTITEQDEVGGSFLQHEGPMHLDGEVPTEHIQEESTSKD